MAKYVIQLNYNAVIDVEVDANDEGDALGKARAIAEDSDMNEFVLTSERESQVISCE